MLTLRVYTSTNKYLYKIIDVVGDSNYPQKRRITKEEYNNLQSQGITLIRARQAKLIKPRHHKRLNSFLIEFLGNDFIL